MAIAGGCSRAHRGDQTRPSSDDRRPGRRPFVEAGRDTRVRERRGTGECVSIRSGHRARVRPGRSWTDVASPWEDFMHLCADLRMRNQRGTALLEAAITIPHAAARRCRHLRIRPRVPDVAGAHQCRARGGTPFLDAQRHIAERDGRGPQLHADRPALQARVGRGHGEPRGDDRRERLDRIGVADHDRLSVPFMVLQPVARLVSPGTSLGAPITIQAQPSCETKPRSGASRANILASSWTAPA